MGRRRGFYAEALLCCEIASSQEKRHLAENHMFQKQSQQAFLHVRNDSQRYV